MNEIVDASAKSDRDWEVRPPRVASSAPLPNPVCALKLPVPIREPAGLRKWLLTADSATAGLLVLLGFVWLGNWAHYSWHLPLPGMVAGFTLFALVLALTQKSRRTWPPGTTGHVQPVASRLLAHLGLLFVPAGVGIITQADVLRQAWLPVLVAAVGSTLIGLAVTGGLMHRLAPKLPVKNP